MRTSIVAAAVAAAVLAPATAQAHVTLQPSSAAAGSYVRLDVRVPNERDDASTRQVEIQFPEGFESASYAPVPGWNVKVAKDGEQVSTITWTADDEDDAIPPGAFQDFGLSLRMPEQEGALTFKALQTYTGGEVVRWIGAEDSDNPAPTVTVAPAEGDAGHGTDHAEEEATAAPTAEPAERTSATTDDGGGSDGLAIVALIVGALGLVTGVAGLLAARRARA